VLPSGDDQVVESNAEPPIDRKRKKRKAAAGSGTEASPSKIRKQPSRASKGNINYKSYGESGVKIKDNSFGMFADCAVDVSKIRYRDIHSDGKIEREDDPRVDEIKFCMLAETNQDPTSYREAINSGDAKQWVEAVQEEL